MKKYKTTKKLYSREYRKKNKKKIREYGRKTSKEIVARAKARRELKKKGVELKGKEVHHKDGNPLNNSRKNLAIAKKHHGGGRKRASTIKRGSKRSK